jgi:archaeal preflagellin peptidase FlaK
LTNLAEGILAADVAVLIGGFAYASAADLKTREVSDHLWQVLGLVGVGLGLVALLGDGPIALGLWILVGAFTLQHVFAWDELLGKRWEPAADLLEAVVYAVVIILVVVSIVRFGIGATGVPWAVVAVLVTVLFARGLFEAGVLYGGADAKAFMIAGVLVPTFSAVAIPVSGSFQLLLETLPYPIDLLMNAALLSLAIPIVIGLRNVARGEFRFPAGFTGYMLPVNELPRRFVWLEDPRAAGGRSRDDLETAEDDQEERERVAADLTARGVRRVWVTPQIPFLVLLFAGAVAAFLAGNLVLDLIALA